MQAGVRGRRLFNGHQCTYHATRRERHEMRSTVVAWSCTTPVLVLYHRRFGQV